MQHIHKESIIRLAMKCLSFAAIAGIFYVLLCPVFHERNITRHNRHQDGDQSDSAVTTVLYLLFNRQKVHSLIYQEYSCDSMGNVLTKQDPRGKVWT